jgi:hypothetical protein
MKKLSILTVMIIVCVSLLQGLIYETSVDYVSRRRIDTTLTITNNSASAFDYTFPHTGWHGLMLDGVVVEGGGLTILYYFHLEPWQTITDELDHYTTVPIPVGNHTVQSAMYWGGYTPVGNIVPITVHETYYMIDMDISVESISTDSLSFIFSMTNNSGQVWGMNYGWYWIYITLNGEQQTLTGLEAPMQLGLDDGENYTCRLVYNPVQPIPYGQHEIRFYIQDYQSEPYIEYPVPIYINLTGTIDEVNPPLQFTTYPNPFRDRVALQVKSEEPGPAVISIYNTKGQLIRREELNLHTGELTYEWDGTDNLSRTAPRGLYIFKLSTASSSKTIKSIKLQ